MDHRDEFSKWMATVETALRSESTPVLDENIPAVNECGCGSWNCPQCFPQQDTMPIGMAGSDPLAVLDGMQGSESAPCPQCGHSEHPTPEPTVCPTCGHDHNDSGEEELVQVDMEPKGMDPMSYGMGELAEEPMEMDVEVDSDSVQSLAAKLAAGEITYAQFKDELDSLENTEHSMRQGEMGMMGGDTAAGHGAWDRERDDWNDLDDERIDYEDDEFNELDEEPMEMEQQPASEKGRNGGVKLGSIIQKFVPSGSEGEESPLTYGEDNLAEGPDDADFGGPEELEMGSPMSRQDYAGAMEQMDPEEAMEMISEIKYMQNMGLSMASKDFSEEEMANMNPSQLKKILNMVRGTVSEEDEMMQDAGMDAATGGTLGAAAGGGGGGGQYAPGTAPTMPESIQQGKPTMENIDKDIAAMLTSLKKYDKLTESVLGMTTTKMARPVVAETSQQRGTENTEKTAQDAFTAKRAQKRRDDDEAWAKSKGKSPVEEASESKKPDFLDFDKDEDKKEPMTKALKDKEKKEEVKEGADKDVLDWMSRFSKLGNMKGYGR